jgi:lysophospholipase L1-like esterase
MTGQTERARRRTDAHTALLAGVLILLVAGGPVLVGCTPAGSTVIDATAPGVTATSTPLPTTSPGTAADPAGIFVMPPPGSRVIVFGDSYTEGTGATSPEAAYPVQLAAHFGWVVDSRGVGGTGFVARGTIDANYLDRLATLPAEAPALLIVQGGLNDALAGVTDADELAAAREVLRALGDRYPGTELIVLGPPQTQIVDAAAVLGVDNALRQASQELGVPYISPLAEKWDVQQFTAADGLHPDDAGYVYLARRLAESLDLLSG